MGENFEKDKIILAIALAIFTVIMSSNVGSIFYVTQTVPLKKGFEVEIVASQDQGITPSKGLPDIIDMAVALANASADLGKQIFNKCAVCHTIGKGEANKIGPNLWNIIGSPTAKHIDFAYSSAMKKRGSDGKKWDFEDLYRYLYSPKQYVPGTKMAFAGLKKDEDRANLIMYLRSMADNPLPLPTSSKAK